MKVYEKIKRLGEGSSGKVWLVKNNITGEKYAMKKVSNSTGKNEAQHLKNLNHTNVLSLIETIESMNSTVTTMFLELMDSNLHECIQTVQLLDADIKKYMKMIISGGAYIHSLNICHRDIKPSNILISKEGILKISDFGQAELIVGDHSTEYESGYIRRNSTLNKFGSRNYRAPELFISSSSFTHATLDSWSIGCVFAEMYIRDVLFKGNTDIDQFQVITNSLPMLDQFLPGINEEGMILLKGLLNMNPKGRYDLANLINDPFVNKSSLV